jgi:hypothetical protein
MARLDAPKANSDAEVMWGELRQLMAGTTSIAGSGGTNGHLRNLDKKGLTEGLPKTISSTTFPLGDTNGTMLDKNCAYPRLPDPSAIAGSNFQAHVGEGICLDARNEFPPGAPLFVCSGEYFRHYGIDIVDEDGDKYRHLRS